MEYAYIIKLVAYWIYDQRGMTLLLTAIWSATARTIVSKNYDTLYHNRGSLKSVRKLESEAQNAMIHFSSHKLGSKLDWQHASVRKGLNLCFIGKQGLPNPLTQAANLLLIVGLPDLVFLLELTVLLSDAVFYLAPQLQLLLEACVRSHLGPRGAHVA